MEREINTGTNVHHTHTRKAINILVHGAVDEAINMKSSKDYDYRMHIYTCKIRLQKIMMSLKDINTWKATTGYDCEF